jgi:hypothetical protein
MFLFSKFWIIFSDLKVTTNLSGNISHFLFLEVIQFAKYFSKMKRPSSLTL